MQEKNKQQKEGEKKGKEKEKIKKNREDKQQPNASLTTPNPAEWVTGAGLKRIQKMKLSAPPLLQPTPAISIIAQKMLRFR